MQWRVMGFLCPFKHMANDKVKAKIQATGGTTELNYMPQILTAEYVKGDGGENSAGP